MRSVRIAILLSVMGLVCAPFLVTRSHAERAANNGKAPLASKRTNSVAPAPATSQGPAQSQEMVIVGPRVDAAPIDPAIIEQLGLGQSQAPVSKGQSVQGVAPQSAGLPTNMNASAPFSTAVATTVAKGFFELDAMGDWDGREDDTADHSGKVMDATNVPAPAASDSRFFFTRTAFSEHTIANGFTEDIIYSADSVGNIYVASTTNMGLAAPTPTVFTINIPTAAFSFGSVTPGASSQFVVTGLAVNPVADLGSVSAVNGLYAADFPAGTVGEMLYVAVTDIGSGFTIGASPVLRSAVFAFPISDAVNAGAPAPPQRISPASFPVTVGGGFGVAYSTFANLAGCAVDDDGNLYFQQVDLSGLTGANIVKVTSKDSPGVAPFTCPNPATCPNQDRSLVTNVVLTSTTLNPAGGSYGNTSGPANQVNTFTNYSGTSTFAGNIISLATGSGNLLYAGVARSFNASDSVADRATEGPFQNEAALGATPSMVITFADANGSFDNCSAPNRWNGAGVLPCPGCPASTRVGVIPVGDGFADTVPGANTNWLAFVLGNGPDRRTATGADSIVFGTSATTLKLDMGIDHSAYSGLTVDEEGTVYVISGASPSGVGSSPSNSRSEILNFEDNRPANRRADYIDFRGDVLPNPPSSGGNVGDGDSDRFDHVYYVAPIDVSTLAPAGLSGLTRGFLRYTNRLAPTEISPGIGLGKVGGARTQGDDESAGEETGGGGTAAPILFDSLDPSHQVAGGDDQVFPFRGDDNDGAGNPAFPGPLNGGFEFTIANPLGDVFSFGAACGAGNGVWNGFFLNSNGNLTFGAGDDSNIPTDTAFRSTIPRIAPAWSDLDPASRTSGFGGTFPVQAIGFSGVNAFKVRYINVPQFGDESCASNNATGSGMTNTFSVTMYDDGTGVDENANQPLNPANPIGNNAVPFDLQEGPTDLRFVPVTTPSATTLVGEPLRLDGSGLHGFTYGRMDLLGSDSLPVIAGFSIGKQAATNPPGLCELNLSADAAAADTGFGNIDSQTEVRWPTFIGDGTEPEIHQYFHNGVAATIDPGTGVFTLSQPDFDLRFQGNGNANPANPIPAGEVNRDHVGLYGTTCALPANPIVLGTIANPFVTTPSTSGTSLINAYAPVTINILGTGFFANEATSVCGSPGSGDGASPDITVPIARPGKTVSTAITVSFDTNGDAVPDLPVSLTNITIVSRNLITAIAAPLANGSGTGAGSPWPLAAPGGNATVTATSTIAAGNNNIFNLLAGGGFTRSGASIMDTGARAPVVIGSSPASGDSGSAQSLTILGYGFQSLISTSNPPASPPTNAIRPFTANGVFAVQRDNPANVIQATSFNVLNNNSISAVFNFNNAPVGTQFLIFVKNAAGNSRNAVTPPPGGSPAGNEQGNFILFTTIDTTPPTITCPANINVNVGAGVSSTTVSYTTPTGTDNLGGPVNVSCDHASGSSFNVGTTLVTCTATDQSGNIGSCSFNVSVVGSNSMHFSAATYTGAEGCTGTAVTVVRDNPFGSASVDLNTSDGSATQKSDYELASATLTFNPGETLKVFTVLSNEDTLLEGPETYNVTLSNPQNGFIGNGAASSTVTITDNDVVAPTTNAIDVPATFVCEQYHDFLNRDPDTAGANFWTGQITACGVNAACIENARVNVSAAFFLSIEFQETGGDVLRIQRTAFGKRSGNAVLRVPYLQYMHDAQQIGRGVIIGQAGAQALLDANKSAYATQIVSSTAFITLFPTSQTAATYVDALFSSAGVTPSADERNAAIAAFASGGTAGRAAALQSVADSNSVRSAEFNAAFVLMQYYGYLRRNPTDAPDNNDTGYQFWLTKLNAFNGNFINAEMVKAFLNSNEYRQRFGP